MAVEDDIVGSIENRQRLRDEVTVYSGMEADPEKAGRAYQLAQSTGADPNVILNNMPDFERRHVAQLSSGVVEHDPWLKQYVNHDEMAAKVSNDDWHNLALFSGVMQQWPQSVFGGMIKGLANKQEMQDIWDISKEGIKQIVRAPVDITGIAAPPESVVKDAEDIEKELIRQGHSPEVARKAAEGFLRRAQRGSGVLGLIAGGAAVLYPQATAGFTLLSGSFRTEARRLYEKTGVPMEVSEGFGMSVLAAFGMFKMFQGKRGTLQSDVSKLQEIIDAAEPYARAGESTPPGTHWAIDRLIAEQSKEVMKEVHDEALKTSEASSTKERVPDFVRNLARFHTQADMWIDSDAARRLYKDKVLAADDKLLGWDDSMADQLANSEYSGGYIKVKVHDWLAYVDKEVAKQLHDDIKLHPDLMTLNEAKRLPEAAREIEYKSIYDHIREAAGIRSRPAQLELDVTRPEEKPAYEPSAVGLTGKQYEMWMEHIRKENAGDNAERVRIAREEIRLERSREWKANWGPTQEGVERDFNLTPTFQIANYLQTGAIRGTGAGPRPKFDPKFVPKELRATLDKYLAKDGLNPDDMAGEFGYGSGKEMIEDIAKYELDRGLRGPKEYFDGVVKAETQRRMEKQYGKPAEVALREAQEHVIDDNKLGYLSENVIRAAQEAGATPTFTRAQVKAWAAKRFNDLPFTRKGMDEWLKASGKNGRLGLDAELKGNWSEALRYYQEQKHAFAIAMEAKKFGKQIDRFDKFVKKHSVKNVEGIPREHQDHVQDLLRRGGVTTRRDPESLDAELARRSSFREFYESRISRDLPEGYEHYDADYVPTMSVWEDLLEPGWTQRVEDMKIGEFKAYNDSLHSIAKDGREQFKIKIADDILDKREVREGLLNELRQFSEKPIREYKTGETKPLYFRRMGVGLLQLEHIFNRISHRNPDGAFNKLLLDIMDAGNEYSALVKKFSNRYSEIEEKYKTDLTEQIPNKVFIEPLSMVRDSEGKLIAPPGEQKYMRMTRNKLRGVLLNMGNESNFDKMGRGHVTTKDAIEKWAWDHATKADWDYVEEIGNLFKDLQKLTDQVTRSMTDSVIDKIPVRDVVTPYGAKKGWYYPMIYDRTRAAGPMREKLELGKFHNILARTSQGFEKTRTGFAAPIDFNTGSMTNHIERRLRDIAFREPVHELGKMFYDTDFRREMTNRMGPHYTDLLDPYLRDVAGMPGMTSANQNALQRVGEAARVNTIGVLIGWNPSTVMKHGPTALAHSIQEVGVDWYMKAMNDLHKTNPFTSESNIKFMMEGGRVGNLNWEGSKELQRRVQHWKETMGGAEDIVMGKPTFGQRFRAGGAKWVAWSDLVSSRVLWLAKYTEQMEAQLAKDPTMPIEQAHTYANRLAERAIRNAHGSTAITAKPEFMRKQDFLHRGLTSLYGFWNNTFNRFYRMGTQNIDLAKAIGRGEAPTFSEIDDLVGQFMTYVVFPAFIEEKVTPLLNSEHLTGAQLAGLGLLHLVGGAFPIVNEVTRAVASGRDPSTGMIGAGQQMVRNVVRDFTRMPDKYTAGNQLEHLIMLAGLAKGWGSSQVGRWAKAILNQIILQTERFPRTEQEFYNTFRYGTIEEPGHRKRHRR